MCHERWTRYSQEALQGRWLRDLSQPGERSEDQPRAAAEQPLRDQRAAEPQTVVATAEA